jgi:hypothetical protein
MRRRHDSIANPEPGAHEALSVQPRAETGVTDRLTLAVTGHPTGLTAVLVDGAAVVAGPDPTTLTVLA